jgi:uncharacterized DUF497 family protein
MFEWDRNNLRKIRAHGIRPEEVEESLANDPLLIYEQQVEGEIRFLYYSETGAGRLIAAVVTERKNKLRVVTAYDLDPGQKRDYFAHRAAGG